MYAIVALDAAQRGMHGTPDGDEGALPDPSGLVLHYRVPEYLQGYVVPGQLVTVPLRDKSAYGVVVEMAETSPVETTRPIGKLIDARPVLSPQMLELARWIATYYGCTLWQALAPMLPPGAARRAITTVGLSQSALATSGEGDRLMEALGRRQRQVVSLLKDAPKNSLTV